MMKNLLFGILCSLVSTLAWANPVANVSGPDLVLSGSAVELSGSNSIGNALRYRWKMVEKPVGSSAQSSSGATPNVSFVADRAGVYLLELRVLEGNSWSAPRYHTVSSVVTSGEIVLGPEDYEPSFLCKLTLGFYDCEEVLREFNVSDIGSEYSIILENSGVKKAFLNLNGTDISDFYQLSGDENEVVVKKVNLQAENQLKIRFGRPGSLGELNGKITLKIVKNLLPNDQNTAPTVTAAPIIFYGSDGGFTQLSITDPDQTTGHHISVLVPAKSGDISLSSSGVVTYSPDFFSYENDEVVLLVKDSGNPQKATAIVIPILFQSGNQPPRLESGFPMFGNGQTLSGKVIVRDTVEQSHTYAISDNPLNGTLAIDSTGMLTYIPNDHFVGLDSFKVLVTDNGTPSAQSEILIAVEIFENHYPSVQLPTLFTEQGVTVTGNVVFSDIDQGQELAIALAQMPEHGMATISQTGALVYTPDPGFYGQELIDIVVRDNAHPPKETNVQVSVTVFENKPPTLFLSRSAIKSSPGLPAIINYSSADQNINQIHTFAISTPPTNGTATLSNGILTYTANVGFVGNDELIVSVTDNGFPSKTAFAKLSIQVEENHPPIPTFSGMTNTAGKKRSISIYHGDIDQGQLHTYAISQYPSHGTLIPDPYWAYTFIYTPEPGYLGNDQFKIVVTDNGAPILSSEIVITMNVIENSPPTIFPLEPIKLAQQSVWSFYLRAIDNDGDGIQFRQIGESSLGTVSFYGSLVSFNANKGISGVGSITLEAKDDGEPSLSTIVEVPVEVLENKPPAPKNQNKIMSTNQSLAIYVPAEDPDGLQRHTYVIAVPPSNGTVVINGNGGDFTYTPNNNFVGVDEFTLRVTDNGSPALSAEATVTISVQQNFPPSPIANDIKILDNQFGRSTVIANDPNTTQTHQYSIVGAPSYGSASVDSRLGTVFYTPNANYFGQDQIIVAVKDNGVPSLTTNVAISVEVEKNLPPNPIAANLVTFQGRNGSVEVFPNDPNTSPSQSFNYTIERQPANGTVTGWKTYTYKPSFGFYGNDSFVIRVTDSGTPALSTLKTINVQVERNVDPVLIASDLSTFQGIPVSGNLNFTDAEPDQNHSYYVVSQGQKGSAFVDYINGVYKVTYYPAYGQTGSDSFVLAVRDDAIPNGVGTKTINVNITANTAPSVIANNLSTFQSTTVTGQVNFTDPDAGQTHTYSITNSPAHGSAQINTSGLLTYTPYGGYSGEDSLTVAVSDSASPAGVGTKVVNITVVPNSIPVIIAGNMTVPQGSNGTLQINFTDSDVGQTHSYEISQYPTYGVAAIDANGVLSYWPHSFCGTFSDSVKVVVRDNAIPNGVAEKEIAINIIPNTLPSVTVANLSVRQRDNITTQIVVSDPDPDEIFYYSILSFPQFGGAAVNSSGLVSYISSGPESLTDTFQISVKDRLGYCAGREVVKTINVDIAPNAAPVLSAADIMVEEGTQIQSRASFTDIDLSQAHFYQISQAPAKGQVNIDATSGDISYVPFANQVGGDSFKVKVVDNGFPSLSIVPLNFPPVPTAGPIALLDGKSATTLVLAYDANVGQTHTFEVISQPQFGMASISSTGLFTYTAFQGMEGSELIQIKVTDNGQFPRFATYDIPVEVVRNLAPNPADLTIAQAVSGMSLEAMIAPNDPNQLRFPQTYSFALLSQPSSGSASINGQGKLIYTAPVGFVGQVQFDVGVTDEGMPALTGVAQVSINVLENSAPVVAALSLETTKNTSLQRSIEFTDTNSSQQTFTYSISAAPTHGTATVNAAGVLTYNPNLNYFGTDQLTVRVTDNGNPALYGEATYTINVADSANTPPTMASLTFVTAHDSLPKKYEFTINNLADADGTVSEVRVDFGDNSGILVLNNNQAIVKSGESSLSRFNHNYFANGTYQVRVTLIDNLGAQAQYVIPTVVQDNIAPVARVNYSPLSGPTPLSLVADASTSTDADGSIVSFCINIFKDDVSIGRQCNTSGLVINYQLADEGTYRISGCVTDNKRTYSCSPQFIYVGVDRPSLSAFTGNAIIDSSVRAGTAPLNNVSLSAARSTGFNGAAIVEYQWAVRSYVSSRFGTHYEEFMTGVNPVINLPYAGVYDVSLLVVDENGFRASTTTKIYAETTTSTPFNIVALYQGDHSFQFKINVFGQALSWDKSFWEFEDGTIQRGFEAQKILNDGDIHQVKFISYDQFGNRSETLKVIDLSTTPARAPLISMGIIPPSVQVNQEFNLSALGTSDPLDNSLRFRWWMGDGSLPIDGVGSLFAQVNHTYTTIGPKTVRLLVTNNMGISSEMTFMINAVIGQPPSLIASLTPKAGLAPLLVSATAEATDVDGTIVSYTWRMDAGNFGRTYQGQNISTVYAKTGDYRVTVTAKDNSGNTVTQVVDTVEVGAYNKIPALADVTLSVPQNKKLTYDIEYADEDENAQLHSFSIVSAPLNGVATISSEGRLVYLPNTDYIGTDTLRVRVTDNSTVPAYGEATITIQVTGDVNANPVLGSLSYNYDQASFPRRVIFAMPDPVDPDGEVVKLTWNFGDGSAPIILEGNQVDNFREISHVYKVTGTFTVLVTAEDNQGGLATQSLNVVMASNALPVPRFTYSESGTGPYQLTLDASASTDANGTITRYCWRVFKDNADALNVCGTNPIQVVNVPTAGVAIVSLSVMDNARGISRYQANLNIGAANNFPPFNFFDTAGTRRGAAPLTIAWLSGNTVAYQGKSIVNKYWSLSDWLYSDNFFENASVTAVYKFPGTHITQMTAVDSSGQYSTSYRYVHVGADMPIVADFTVSSDDSQTINFNAADWTKGHWTNFFLWSFGDGTYAYERYASHTYNQSGSFRVRLTVMDIHGALSTKEQIILVGDESAEAVIDGDYRIYKTFGEPADFAVTSTNSDDVVRWNFGDGSFDSGEISSKAEVTHTYSQPGIYRVRANVTSERTGLSRDFYKVVIVNNEATAPNTIIQSSSTQGNVPMNVSFTATHSGGFTPTSYQWVIKNDRNEIVHINSGSAPTYNFKTLGIYFIALTVKDVNLNVDYADLVVSVGSGTKKKGVLLTPKPAPLSMRELEILKSIRKNYVTE